MKIPKTFASAAALLSLLAFGACKSKEAGETAEETQQPKAEPTGGESSARADTEEAILAVEGMT